ncbi:23S rRNA (adenine(2503)-C(2))-methyltransferase RlmN [Candidatus Uhrbacteria bacterium]|nr:23S rRNA (adenine(2503)-C(2))-methyltransferase RlmN [Candidatus Uhrbacteria bacterium]MBD3284525.1 23S rRNA (adenine(2503)-C(2))-methyltransferase RlmN [Candidatus Uhrbacteria bacterium]
MNREALTQFLHREEQPAYRYKQALQAFCVEHQSSWESITPWPKALRERAAKAVPWDTLTLRLAQESMKQDAVKFLFACTDGVLIETVLMRHEDKRNTVCISSQAGCPMGCTFCATGAMGLTRNLTADELFEQVVQVARWLDTSSCHVTNVVYMGMGEPMHNYDAVMTSVRMLNEQGGFNLGARHISISTCGITPGIQKLAKEPEQVNLAISLHAAMPDIRTRIMPVNRAYPIDVLMRAVRTYVQKTNRRVMFEYLLLQNINDSEEDAQCLADLLSENPKLYHVNLIKYHDTQVYTASGRDRRTQFLSRLHKRGISATIRQSFGEDILAACGQLACLEPHH